MKDLDQVAGQLDKDIEKELSKDSRPIMPIANKPEDTDPHSRVKLRCESIIYMAFQVWMREVRGETPFIGPIDMWKFNEMKNLLFSIGEGNGEFRPPAK